MPNKIPLYPYSAKTAQERGEIEKWRESFRENCACAGGIDILIRENFDGMHLKDGTVETDENDHALNIYANYDMQRQQVCDELEITLYGSGIEDQSLTYHLNAAEKEVLREKMEAHCMQREHKPLDQLCQEILQEQDAPTQEMQL